jgi:hypothetical protein
MLNGSGPATLSFSDRLAYWQQGISAAANRVADALHRWKYGVLFVFSILYLLATCFRASRKLFWFDELATVYVSRLPDMASIWSALKHGADLNPPLFYGLTRFSESLFGEGHVAVRLPEILGFWILCLCLFRFVSIRSSVLAGTISMLFPLVTTAYYYAYEARPHGIVLGFGGVALVCWQGAIRSRRRTWWLIGLFVALLCAILNHAYGVLMIVPLTLAEFTRSLMLRRIDWTVWLAILASLAGILPTMTLWGGAKAGIQSIVFFPANFSVTANSYQFILGPAIAVFAAGLILYFVADFFRPDLSAAPHGEQSLELPELVALLAFAAMPFFAYLVSRLTGAPLFTRYCISTVIGFGCLFGIMMAKRPLAGLGVLLCLVAQIGITFVKYAQTDTIIEPTTSLRLSTKANDFAEMYRRMEALPDKTSPIVLLDNLEFFPIIHYAPADIASRLVYVSVGFQPNFEGYLNLQRFCHAATGHTAKMPEFLSTHDTFLLYVNARTLFQINDLMRKGAEVKVESVSEDWFVDNFLVSVTFKNHPSNSAVTPIQ